MKDDRFWRKLDELVAAHPLKVDRPQGSAHPRHPAFIYPLDYGYLEGTQSGDGDGIDVWVGSLLARQVTGIVCSVDLEQRDAEVKLLLGCTLEETQTIIQVHQGAQAAMWVARIKKPGFPWHCPPGQV